MNPASSGAIEEIVARCLVDPAFLDSVRADPDSALAAYPLDAQARAAFRTADLARLRQFSGFIGKIQHNFLWDSFPATRQLLRRHGIEHEVFAHYRRLQLAPGSRAAALPEKVRLFLSFLEGYLVEGGRHPSLQAVMRHERAVWEVRQAAATRPQARASVREVSFAGLPWRRFARLVPVINGPLRIEAFDRDPVALTARVLEGRAETRARRGARLLVYWADPATQQLRTLAVESLPALMLSLVDGARSVGAVVAATRRRTLADAPPSAFRPFFEDSARTGLLCLMAKEA